MMTEIILQELNKKQNVTLSDLYEILSNDSRIKMNKKSLKHYVRARLYSLEKSQKVTRVKRATFSKL